jgi:hypothetical protein
LSEAKPGSALKAAPPTPYFASLDPGYELNLHDSQRV